MKIDAIKFSIICPVYNSESFLDECIKSVINQKYDNWELILINDGSTDKSKSICNQYSIKDKRIILINQDNAGQFIARLNGIHKASGDYLLFLDSDDALVNNALNILYSTIINNASDIVWFSYLYEAQQLSNKFFLAETDEIKCGKPLEELFAKRIGFFLWDKCFSAKLFRNLKIDVDFKFNNFAEDTLMVYLISKNASTINIIKDKLYFYRFNENSKVHNISREDQIGRDYIYSYIFSNIIKRYSVKSNVFEIYVDKYIDLVFKIIIFTKGKEYRSAIKYIHKNYGQSFNINLNSYFGSKKRKLIYMFYKKKMFFATRVLSLLILRKDYK